MKLREEEAVVASPVRDHRVQVAQKWGFGMAPVKPDIEQKRRQSVAAVLSYLQNDPIESSTSLLEALSEVKGLYSRCHKQDQWDWFTVWQQLGRPGRKRCLQVGDALSRLRTAIRDGDDATAAKQLTLLTDADVQVQLAGLVGEQPRETRGAGYIYVLSTREQPRMLKIGYTERTVEERVREINRATGVVIPYGVRALWVVADAPSVEAELHDRLAPYRVRKDREFFNLDFRDASALIQGYIDGLRRED
ncbi:GIY-YIG nuclease family protein [Micromonospora ureilytica]|uniref:GIY-YIG nuclease family protein n=1 Tax=Micromonospora ureilytica TaxID=709868 RepID=UPI004039DD2A